MAAETPISVERLLEACGASSLDQVRSVNFWAKKLTSKQVQQTVGQCANLEVASLSINEVDSLKAFKGNTQLQELFLRKNNVADIREVGHLAVSCLCQRWAQFPQHAPPACSAPRTCPYVSCGCPTIPVINMSCTVS